MWPIAWTNFTNLNYSALLNWLWGNIYQCKYRTVSDSSTRLFYMRFCWRWCVTYHNVLDFSFLPSPPLLLTGEIILLLGIDNCLLFTDFRGDLGTKAWEHKLKKLEGRVITKNIIGMTLLQDCYVVSMQDRPGMVYITYCIMRRWHRIDVYHSDNIQAHGISRLQTTRLRCQPGTRLLVQYNQTDLMSVGEWCSELLLPRLGVPAGLMGDLYLRGDFGELITGLPSVGGRGGTATSGSDQPGRAISAFTCFTDANTSLEPNGTAVVYE